MCSQVLYISWKDYQHEHSVRKIQEIYKVKLKQKDSLKIGEKKHGGNNGERKDWREAGRGRDEGGGEGETDAGRGKDGGANAGETERGKKGGEEEEAD